MDTLYLDFDGTIVNTIKCIVDLYNKDFRYYNNFKHINWWEVETWEFSECELATAEYLDQYFNQPRFFKNLEFMSWGESSINELNDSFEIKIVSVGSQPNLVGKEEWIKKHFPFIEFIGVDINRYDDKSHIDMGDGIIVDDSSINLKTSNAAKRICFGDKYIWNEDWNGIRAMNWMDLKKILLEDDRQNNLKS